MTETSDRFLDRYIEHKGKITQEEVDIAKRALHWFTLLENEPRDQLEYVIEDFFKLDRHVQELVLLFVRGALESDMEEGIRNVKD